MQVTDPLLSNMYGQARLPVADGTPFVRTDDAVMPLSHPAANTTNKASAVRRGSGEDNNQIVPPGKTRRPEYSRRRRRMTTIVQSWPTISTGTAGTSANCSPAIGRRLIAEASTTTRATAAATPVIAMIQGARRLRRGTKRCGGCDGAGVSCPNSKPDAPAGGSWYSSVSPSRTTLVGQPFEK